MSLSSFDLVISFNVVARIGPKKSILLNVFAVLANEDLES